jgi:flagellar basal-body rod protein FlgC
VSLFNIFDVASSGLRAQNVRLNLTASNLANVNTVVGSKAEAYRSRHPVFSAVLDGIGTNRSGIGGVETTRVVESRAEPDARYFPGHPLADDNGYVYSSNVSAVDEMTDMISASRSYQLNVELMTASKKLVEKTLTLGQ